MCRRPVQVRRTRDAPAAPDAEPPSDPGGTTDDWLITWGDAISLLLGFFVLLFSVSEIDTDRFAQVAEALASRSEIDEEVPEVVAEVLTGREIVDRVQGTLQPMMDAGSVVIDKLPAGARVSFDADALFDGPGTTLRPEVEPLLTTLAGKPPAGHAALHHRGAGGSVVGCRRCAGGVSRTLHG